MPGILFGVEALFYQLCREMVQASVKNRESQSVFTLEIVVEISFTDAGLSKNLVYRGVVESAAMNESRCRIYDMFTSTCHL